MVAPHPEIEATMEQLSTLHSLIAVGQNPYVDFAVFGTHPNRVYKRMKLHGEQISATGKSIPIELYGPASYASWKGAWHLKTS